MRISVSVIALFVSCFLLALPASAETFERSVTVVGQATVIVVPDAAEITAGVVSTGKSATQAMADNSERMSRVFEGLQALEVNKRELRTRGFSVVPVYERTSREYDKPPRITGYRVNNTVHIRLRDAGDVGRVLDRLVDLGANNVNGVQFVISDRYERTQEALAGAVENARDRAALIARAAGAKLGPVVEVRESVTGAPRPALAVQMRAESSDVPIASGEETLHVTVQATFALE